MGLTLAEHLIKSVRASLILVGRSALPEKDSWDQWLSTHEDQDTTSRKIRKIQGFEALGSKVLTFSADVSNEEQMQAVVCQALEQFGHIHGVIHTAGVADYAGVIQKRTREATEAVIAAKVKGTLILESLLQDCKLDFLVLCSTLGSILYNAKFGQVGYSAANEFLDAYAYSKSFRNGTLTAAINWTDWNEVGMSVEALNYWTQTYGITEKSDILSFTLSPKEGLEVFDRVLEYSFPRVAVSPHELSNVIAYFNESSQPLLLESIEKWTLSKPAHQRPELHTAYVAPEGNLEQSIAHIWEELLGIQQIGSHDDFFDLGGHSLLATRVISRIREQFQVELSMTKLFDNPTVAGLAEHVKAIQMVIHNMQPVQHNTEDYEEEEI